MRYRKPASVAAKEDLEQYRNYLRALADMQLDPRLRTKEDISDIVQLTLVQAHQSLATFRGKTEAELRGWLKMILTRKLINLRKRYTAQRRDIRRELSIDQQLQQSAVRMAGQLQVDQSTPVQHIMLQERAERLAVALAGLLEDERTAVVLKYTHDWKVAVIAEHIDRSPDAVAGLLRRAIKKLRSAMQEPLSDD